MGLVHGSGWLSSTPTAEAASERSVTPPARGILVERAQSGDREAFEGLLERWLEPALRTAHAILGNDADARDATQDAFLQAWRELRRLRRPRALRCLAQPHPRQPLPHRPQQPLANHGPGDPHERPPGV